MLSDRCLSCPVLSCLSVTLVYCGQSFISKRLQDYCNGTLVGITDQLMQRLHAVQNAAARLIVGARKFDSVTHVLCDLHWLLVRQCISFKL